MQPKEKTFDRTIQYSKDSPPIGMVDVPLVKGIVKQPSGELTLDFEWCRLPVFSFVEYSSEDHTPGSTPVQFLPAWPPAPPPAHGRGWPRVAPPPASARG